MRIWLWIIFIGIILIFFGSIIISVGSNTESSKLGSVFIVVGILGFIFGLYGLHKIPSSKIKEE